MDTKKLLRISVLLILSSFSLASSCEKNDGTCKIYYQFEEPISIYPEKDTFQLGDTFFIEVNTPTKMHNLSNNSYLDIKDHGIITYLEMYQIHQDDSNRKIDPEHPGYQGALSPDANDKFIFDSKKGFWSLVGNHAAKIDYDTINGNFVHKTAVIVKDTGLFYFRFFDAIGYYVYNYGNNPNLVETDCYQRWNYMYYTVNKGVSNNYLLEKCRITMIFSTGSSGDSQKHNFKHGSWSFVVVP